MFNMFTTGLLIGLAPVAIYVVYKGVQFYKRIKLLESQIEYASKSLELLHSLLLELRTMTDSQIDGIEKRLANAKMKK